MLGYVYILSNPSMPGLVKVGRSQHRPDYRADQLHTTGVPTPFVVEWLGIADDMEMQEQNMHYRLRQHRVASALDAAWNRGRRQLMVERYPNATNVYVSLTFGQYFWFRPSETEVDRIFSGVNPPRKPADVLAALLNEPVSVTYEFSRRYKEDRGWFSFEAPEYKTEKLGQITEQLRKSW